MDNTVTVTVKDVIQYLKAIAPGVSFYNSTINGDQERCVGVYARRNGLIHPEAVGMRSSYAYRSITLLIHWTKNATTCEAQAVELWDALRAREAVTIGGKSCRIMASQPPVTVGADSRGIYECVLDLDILIKD